MKTLIASILIVSTLFLAGCGTIQKGPPVTTAQPVYALDQSGQLVKVGETNLTSNPDKWVPDARLTGAIATAKALGDTGAAIPSPLAPLFAGVSILATLAGGVVTAWGRAKNKELTVSNAALAATTTVIEAAENALALKESARKAAEANGSNDYLHSKVKNL